MQKHHPIIAFWAAENYTTFDECDHLGLHLKTWTGTKQL